MSKKTVLVITDGIGYKPESVANAFKEAQTPTYDTIFEKYPHTLISTHGLSVGLPEGQMGNSEVGHMCLGSGRVLYQDLVKISLALKDASLASNSALKTLLGASKVLHIVGLLSDGGVHSHIDHILGLAKIAQVEGKRVWLHLVSDGRDVSPTSAPKYIEEVEAICGDTIKIATISGRYYTMDRDNRWDRVEKGYRAIVEATPKSDLSIQEYISSSYKSDITDEFIEPTALGDYSGMSSGDSVLIANFRSDRVREITTALGADDFKYFKREVSGLNIATMTQYDATFNYPTLFSKEIPKNTLAQVVSDAGLKQLHTAETEKYAHVTFFFNGGLEEPYINESRVLIPSPDVSTYDLKPEMSASEVGEAVVSALVEGYDFIVVNFANGDMVGHTGKFDAAVKAVEAVDQQLGKILEKSEEYGYNIVLTSDHGNCEEMIDEHGDVLTNHTVGEVWAFVISSKVKRLKEGGGLNNIAATVLELMELAIPEEMDNSLILE